MSLIIDALKKAQELRSKDLRGEILLRNAYPKNKKRIKGSGKQWGAVGFGALGVFLFLFLVLRPISLPPSPSTPQVIASLKKGESAPIEEEKGFEISKEVSGQEPSGELKGQSNLIESKGKEKEESPISPPPSFGEKSLSRVNLKKEKHDQTPSSTPLPSLKEGTSEKSIKVEGDGKKEPTLSFEAINQFNLGVSYQNRKDYVKAIEAYKRAIELDPNYIEAYNNLGILYQEIGDDHSAYETYQRLINVNPDYEKVYNNLGLLFYQRGQYGEALEAFQKALTINPKNLESYLNLGVIYKKQGQWEKAVSSYQKALSINPLHKETHYNIGLLYEQRGEIELAVGHYQKFIQLASQSYPELASRVQRHLNVLIKAREGK